MPNGNGTKTSLTDSIKSAHTMLVLVIAIIGIVAVGVRLFDAVGQNTRSLADLHERVEVLEDDFAEIDRKLDLLICFEVSETTADLKSCEFPNR